MGIGVGFWDEINERIKKASQFYHPVRNKDIDKKCKLDILKIYFKRITIWSRNLDNNEKIG
jgi:hypothetical protein